MSDRYSYLIVTLGSALREEDLQPRIDAINLIDGVVHVARGKPTNVESYVAIVQARRELSDKLWKVLNDV